MVAMGLLNICGVERAFKSLINTVWRDGDTLVSCYPCWEKRGKSRSGGKFQSLCSSSTVSFTVKCWASSSICSILSCLPHTTKRAINTNIPSTGEQATKIHSFCQAVLPILIFSPSSHFCLLKQPLREFKEKGDQLQGDLKKPRTKQPPALMLLQLHPQTELI